jgi:hypothetical protein
MNSAAPCLVLAGFALLGCSDAAWGAISDWSVSPLKIAIGSGSLRLGGDANGAAFATDQPDFAGLDKGGATGELRLFPVLEREYDSGLSIGLHASILAWHDRLSNDRYGGKVFEKTYFAVQTGLGSVELGNTDGAGYRLAVAGPKVDEKVSIDDPEMTFFRNPLTGRAFDEIFTVRAEEGASLNDAKLSYYSPRLFGIQLAGSFAPSEGRNVIPFVSSGPHVANRQKNIWEIAASYSGNFDELAVGASAALSMAHDAAKTPGHEGLTDWALGLAADYSIGDDVKLSLGAALRQANAYAFDVNTVFAAGSTRALHTSASATYGSWIAGVELTSGTADGSLGAPTVGVHGYQASIAYILNSNLQITAGWQRLRYARSSGAFYGGMPSISMNAEYLHLDFHV